MIKYISIALMITIAACSAEPIVEIVKDDKDLIAGDQDKPDPTNEEEQPTPITDPVPDPVPAPIPDPVEDPPTEGPIRINKWNASGWSVLEWQ